MAKLRCPVSMGPQFHLNQWLVYPHGKPPFFMGKSTISMVIFNSYVKLPEGNHSLGPGSYPIWAYYHSEFLTTPTAPRGFQRAPLRELNPPRRLEWYTSVNHRPRNLNCPMFIYISGIHSGIIDNNHNRKYVYINGQWVFVRIYSGLMQKKPLILWHWTRSTEPDDQDGSSTALIWLGGSPAWSKYWMKSQDFP